MSIEDFVDNFELNTELRKNNETTLLIYFIMTIEYMVSNNEESNYIKIFEQSKRIRLEGQENMLNGFLETLLHIYDEYF